MTLLRTSRATALAEAALADAEPASYWLADPARPEPAPPLRGSTRADLAVVGAGYTGLWAALQAKEADPGRDVVLLEQGSAGWAASGRNGGFCSASLTHGLANGAARWPEELDRLLAHGQDNLEAIEATLGRHGIDCAWERTGELTVATAPWQVRELAQAAELAARHGRPAQLLDRAEARGVVDSPTYRAGLLEPGGTAMVHPAKLAWGLRRACLDLGVRLHERTRVLAVEPLGGRVRLRTEAGVVDAGAALLGTGAFPALARGIRSRVVAVYDYALVTEPLGPDRRAALGWAGREGVSDAGNQFHYYRLTADDRLLWGGYDAVYRFGGRVDPRHDASPTTFATLARHLAETFPALADVRFTHRWGGAIDTCSRFAPYWGTALGGRLAYAVGYTGLGVGASRFAAGVALDLLAGARTERTQLRMVREKPLPFPPEPLRWAGISLTRRSLARADAREGRRDLWLRSLDRLGLGFDS